MNYKGAYNSGTDYSQNDVVVYSDDNTAYYAIQDPPTGTDPRNVRFWNRLLSPLQEVTVLFHGMLTTMQAEIASATESGMIAPAYSKKTYNKGDIVTHSGKLYAAKADIGTAENWTAAHWEETTVGAQVAATNAELGTAQGAITDLQGVVFDDKTLVLGSSTESSTKKWAITVDDSDGIEVNEVVEGD